MVNIKGRNTEPWINPTLIQEIITESSIDFNVTSNIPIHCTILTNHSSIPNFYKVHHATSLGSSSNVFSKSKNGKYKFFFAEYFSYNCLKIKMVFVVPHPDIKPKCILSMATCCLSNFSIIFQLSSESDLLISVPYSFLFLKNHLSPYNSLQ